MELIHVQALVAEAAVEALYVSVSHGFAGMRKIELHATLPALLT